MGASPPKRARIACMPCRGQKRKCDGRHPCDTCERYGHECHYRKKTTQDSRHSSRSRHDEASLAVVSTISRGSPNPGRKMHQSPPSLRQNMLGGSINDNSGLSFMKQLLVRLDPENAPKLNLTGWNVGSRSKSHTDNVATANCIVTLLTQTQMVDLARVFFDKVSPCYGFADRDIIFQEIGRRWSNIQVVSAADAVLCGVAAIGSRFSKVLAVPFEQQLVDWAKSLLDTTNTTREPQLILATAWVCRVFYLRVAGDPLSAWIASCTTMHILEAIGFHTVVQSYRAWTADSNWVCNPRLQRRLFCIAQYLNLWISYDLGLSRVNLRAPDIPPSSGWETDYTEKLLELLPMSLSLDPLAKVDEELLTSMLREVTSKHDHQPPLIMAQCNMILCILRRLTNTHLLHTVDDRLLSASLRFLNKGLDAAQQMEEADSPWFQLANVPFQILCTMLAIDTQSSLKMIEQTMRTLLRVKEAYNTPSLKEAHNSACLLLCLHSRRRLEDTKLIDRVLVDAMVTEVSETFIEGDDLNWTAPTETEVTWLHNLMADFSHLARL